MVIALIDDGNAQRGAGEFLRGRKSAEPGADDDDVMQAWLPVPTAFSLASLAHAMSSDPSILGL